jgi:type IV pilus assembly protein PilC
MNGQLEELSFLNQQLAAMLRAGIPLEGSLAELTSRMGRSPLKTELEALRQDLAAGLPLAEALPKRQLPSFYVQTVLAAVRGNDLPAILTLLGDYYGHTHSLWLRLKGLMVYPIIVVIVSLLLSTWVAFLQKPILLRTGVQFTSLKTPADPGAEQAPGQEKELQARGVYFWMPPVLLLALVGSVGLILSSAHLRRKMRWRLPAFKEASLTQFASAMQILLRSGATLHDALDFMIPVEEATPAGHELRRWRAALESGQGKLDTIADGSGVFPPLFTWLATSAGEDLALGFERAAGVYRERALYRSELLLNGFLPGSMLLLGIMVALQVYPLATQAYDSLNRVHTMMRF